MYDWANSVFMTIVILVFPIYFADVAAAGLPSAVASARFAAATTFSMLIVALLSPFLGAAADFAAMKKKMLAACVMLGVVATGGLYFVGRGDWKLGALLFILGNMGVTSSIVFYESLLPHIARQEEVDAFLGGLCHRLCGWRPAAGGEPAHDQRHAWFGIPNGEMAMRLSFLAAALWWLLFSIPLFRRVPEPPVPPELRRKPGENLLRVSVVRLGQTLREVKQYKQTLLFLIAFFIYNDGIGTILRMASIYGTEIGIERGFLIGALLLVKWSRSLLLPLRTLAEDRSQEAIFGPGRHFGISVFGYSMKTPRDFLIMAILVGTVQEQPGSRAPIHHHDPQAQVLRFFAFFSVFEKFAGILGPAVFSLVITAGQPGSHPVAILFFFVGGCCWPGERGEGQQAAAGRARSFTRRPVMLESSGPP